MSTHATSVETLRAAAEAERERVVELCAEMVRIPSPSGGEGDVARRVAAELEAAGLDEVSIDRAGNVVAILRSTSPAAPGAVLLDAHLDCVAEGDPDAWPHPPFGAAIEDGRLWGRGTSDTKGTVAAQVRAVAALAALQREDAITLPRDVVLAAVVQEEVGGLGTACLLEDHAGAFVAAIVGEPSDGALSCGHRGRVELSVAFHGRAAHASRPDWGINPHRSLARFVTRLEGIEREDDPQLGRSSVSPTLVSARPESPNVIPQTLTLTLDWRNVPNEPAERIRERVEALATAACEDGVRASVEVPTKRLVSWTGVERDVERVSRAFVTDRSSPLLDAARRALGLAIEREAETTTWDFASDGGWLHAAGVPCIGYGPGEPRVMHAIDESLRIDRLREAVLGNIALTLALAEAAA